MSHDAEPSATPARPGEPSLAQELEAIPYEPLLPIEKKLIVWCLVLGVVLLGRAPLGQCDLLSGRRLATKG